MLRLRIALFLLVAGLLSACQSGPPPSLEQRIGAWQKTWSNAIEQRQVLANDSALPGEDYMVLRLFARPMDISEVFTMGQSLPVTHYSDRSLPLRLREEFPGMTIAMAGAPRSSRYGRYYHATAVHGDQRCVFAWQVLDRTGESLPPYLRRVEMEYRHCGGDDVSSEALLRPFEQGLVRPDTGVLPLAGQPLVMAPQPLARTPRSQQPAPRRGRPEAASATAAQAPAGAFPLPAAARAAAAARMGDRAAPAAAREVPVAVREPAESQPRRLFNGRAGTRQAGTRQRDYRDLPARPAGAPPSGRATAAPSEAGAAFPMPGGR